MKSTAARILSASLILAATLPMSIQVANAGNDTAGTVNFIGKVVANTCDLSKKDVNVDMGTVVASDFTTKGSYSLAKNFSIDLKNCDASLSGVTVKFGGTPDKSIADDLAIQAGTGAASGLAIEIRANNGKKVSLNNESPIYALKSGANTLNFSALYISTGTVSAGLANATSPFTLQYR